MTTVIKVLSTETPCNTVANTFGANKAVRLLNTDTSAHLITQAYSNGAVIGTITLGAGESFVFEKGLTDTLASNNAAGLVKAVPVAFRN